MTEENKIDLNPIWVTGLPIPPSSNSQYKPFRNKRSGKMRFVPVKGLADYKRQLNLAFFRHPSQFIPNIKKLQMWVEKGIFLEVKATFFLEKKRFLTAKGTPKKMDVSNRIKSLHDGLATALNVDDSYYFKISAEKRLAPKDQPESVCIEILPYFCGS